MKHFCSFSEAIREGAKLKPQGFDYLLFNGTTCAFGAGLEAMGHKLRNGEMVSKVETVTANYPYLRTVLVTCPAVGNHRIACANARSLQDTIFDLNDRHKWTREDIADWLEKEEEKLGFVTLVESSESLQQVGVGVTV